MSLYSKDTGSSCNYIVIIFACIASKRCLQNLTLLDYRMCPNRTQVQGLGCASINLNNKACRLVCTICIYTVNRNRVDLCLQGTWGSGDLCMCGGQTDQKYCSNFNVFHCFCMIFWCFIRHLVWIWCDVFFAAGWCMTVCPLGHALLLGHIR